MKPILSVDKVSSFLGNGAKKKCILHEVCLELAAGECLGILGESGSGKSTLLRILAGLLSASSGTITYTGRRMQMLFQQPEDSFNPRQTLGWSLGEPLRNLGWNRQETTKAIENLLAEVGLDASYLARYPHEVSGGEAQRAALARACSACPDLLLCDEPTSALDANLQLQITELIHEAGRRHHMACLFVTHDVDLLPLVADRVLVLHEGRVVEQGTVHDVLLQPKSAYTKELLEAGLWQFSCLANKTSGSMKK